MPSNMLNNDTMFPAFTEEQSSGEKIDLILNYLRMLVEQLRYSTYNLGVDNFNDAELSELGRIITEPVYIQLRDAEGNIAALQVTAQGLSSRLSDAEGNVSSLQQTAAALTSRITDAEGNISSLVQTSTILTSRISTAEGDISSLTQTASSLTSRISSAEGNISTLQQTASSLFSQISDAEGNLSTLQQYVDGFTLSVTNGDETSVIQLKSGSTTIASGTISMTGMVTFTDLSTRGATTINGSNITTGTISANRIDLTGAITWSDLSNSVQSDIDDAWDMAYDAQSLAADVDDVVGSWSYRYNGTTYIDGEMLMTGTVRASTLEGGEIGILNSRGSEIGYITVGNSTSSGIQLVCGGNLYFESAYCSIQMSGDYIDVTCDAFRPSGAAPDLGTSTYKWQAVYSYTGEIQTSDENCKHDVAPLPQKYLDMMDDIVPVIYKMDNGTSDRYHTGFIAQNVKAAMDAHGVSDTELAAWCRGVDGAGSEQQMLRYSEFIAILWGKIKQLETRVKELEGT